MSIVAARVRVRVQVRGRIRFVVRQQWQSGRVVRANMQRGRFAKGGRWAGQGTTHKENKNLTRPRLGRVNRLVDTYTQNTQHWCPVVDILKALFQLCRRGGYGRIPCTLAHIASGR